MIKKNKTKCIKNPITTKRAAIVLIIILLLSFVPIIIHSGYAFPAADDFSYGSAVHNAVKGGASFAEIIQVAAEQTAHMYDAWQGSFAAVFLMAFQPAVFGEEFYFLTTVIMLLSLVGGMLLFLRELLMKWLKADRWQYAVVSSVMIIMTVHFCYDPVESFYWYNGAVYYLFFYSLSLVLAAAVMAALRCERLIPRISLTAAAAVLCSVIGAGNYSTALCTAVILTVITLMLAIKRDKRAVITGIVLLVGLVTLFISITAPGNSVRQMQTDGFDPIVSVLLSLCLGGYICVNAVTVPVLIGFACITPILYRLAEKSAFSFKHPFIFSVLSFGIMCSQCTPPLYGLGISIPERLLNIIYFSIYILLLLNIYVWCGHISHRAEKLSTQKLSKLISENSTMVFVVALFLFFVTSVGACRITKGDNGVKVEGLPFGVQAVYELVTGEAEAYRKVNMERLEILRDDELSDVVLPEHTVKPKLLYFNDPSDEKNSAIAGYYDKHTVVVS